MSHGQGDPGDDVFPHTVIAVGDRPLCVWDQELTRHNLDFCEKLDPDWFTESVTRHLSAWDGEGEIPQSVALSIRLTYHHALETFFALLFALVQAPYCLPAWLELYGLRDLRLLIERAFMRATILNGWGVPRIGWDDLSKLVNQGSWKSKVEETLSGFSEAWQRLANEFTDDATRAEYNGLKHGFRARPGGGGLRFGLEETPGTAAPEEAMKWIGGSQHGSSAFTIVPISEHETRRNAVHVQLRTTNVLWLAEETVQKVQLLSMSMRNVLSAARIRNGAPPRDVPFFRCEDPKCYGDPWKRSTGVTEFGLHLNGPGEAVLQVSKERLLDRMREASGLKGAG
jgi:hypothetical protein